MDLDALLTTDEAGDLLGLTGRRVLQLVQDGYVARAQRGRVKLRDLVRGYAKSLKASEGPSNSDAQAALARSRKEMLDLQIMKERGELCDVELAVAALQMVVGCVQSEMANWSSRVTTDLGQRAKIDAQVEASMARLRDTLAKGTAELLGELDADAQDEAA